MGASVAFGIALRMVSPARRLFARIVPPAGPAEGNTITPMDVKMDIVSAGSCNARRPARPEANGDRPMRLVLVFIAALSTAASAAPEKWGPTWSEITGARYTKATKNREAAIVKSIDGTDTLKKVVKVEPGRHTVRLQSPSKRGFDGSDQNYDFVFEPCKRYYVNAQFRTTLGGDWEPVVDRVEGIAGCKVDKPK
jgi:hypothetical protein